MEDVSERELEQLKQLEQFAKQIKLILKNQLLLLLLAFFLFLVGSIALIYTRITNSDNRYVARLSLHYYPKQPGKIKPYEEKFMLQMFNSPSLRAKFHETLKDKRFKGVYSRHQVPLRVEKKRNDSFMIVLSANSAQEAVALTNVFARLCLDEYAERRSGDLNKFEAVLVKKKEDIFKVLQDINKEKAAISSPLHVLNPEKGYERIRVEIADQRTARDKVQFVISNLQARQQRLQAELGKINPKLLKHQSDIRERMAEIKKLDKEIGVAREVYTDKNPKLMALLSRRKAMRSDLDDFLRDRGVALDDLDRLDNANRIETELQAVESELANRQEEMAVIESELAEKQQRFDRIALILPRFRELNQRSQSQLESLQKIDESIADVNYLRLLIKDDLFVTEKVVSAVGKSPFRKKYMALAVFIALALTGFTLVVLGILEYIFGKIADEREMLLYPELRYLGKLPVSQKMLGAEMSKQLIFNTVCHHFQNGADSRPHIVIVGSLPGAKILKEFYSAMEWNYAMAGKKFLTVDIVSANIVGDIQPLKDTGIIGFSEGKVVLPITSRKFILPPEMELLKQDLAVLRKNYDLIFFRHPMSFRHDKLFVEQFSELCDSMLVAVGLRKTFRRALRSLVSLQRETNIPVMTVLSDSVASHFSNMMSMEMK